MDAKESSDGALSKIQLTKGQLSDVEKYSAMVFDVCEPNVDTNTYKEFFNKELKNASMLKDESKEIGDLKVSFSSTKWVEFDFVPKSQK